MKDKPGFPNPIQIPSSSFINHQADMKWNSIFMTEQHFASTAQHASVLRWIELSSEHHVAYFDEISLQGYTVCHVDSFFCWWIKIKIPIFSQLTWVYLSRNRYLKWFAWSICEEFSTKMQKTIYLGYLWNKTVSRYLIWKKFHAGIQKLLSKKK